MTKGRVSAVSRRAIAGSSITSTTPHSVRSTVMKEGDFWRAKREPCRRLGSQIGTALLARLKPGGRSLYVRAGVAELPAMLIESLDLHRSVLPYNLRRREVALLNRACRAYLYGFMRRMRHEPSGPFDHLWIVSVLNDPGAVSAVGGVVVWPGNARDL